jgi:hypothetical protein
MEPARYGRYAAHDLGRLLRDGRIAHGASSVVQVNVKIAAEIVNNLV